MIWHTSSEDQQLLDNRRGQGLAVQGVEERVDTTLKIIYKALLLGLEIFEQKSNAEKRILTGVVCRIRLSSPLTTLKMG